MNWNNWDQVEEIVNRNDLRPIVAVVPDNRDQNLIQGECRPDFWERVRQWQHQGWTIALHGYQHVYSTTNAGLLGLNHRSEFAGHPLDSQRERLRAASEIFTSQGIKPQLWVAPAHSFDAATLRALREIGLTTISDGFFPRPIIDQEGFIWIPQQLWRFRASMPGTWTVCLHINSWSQSDIDRFSSDVSAFREKLTNVDEILERAIRRPSILDRAFARCYSALIHMRRAASGTA